MACLQNCAHFSPCLRTSDYATLLWTTPRTNQSSQYDHSICPIVTKSMKNILRESTQQWNLLNHKLNIQNLFHILSNYSTAVQIDISYILWHERVKKRYASRKYSTLLHVCFAAVCRGIHDLLVTEFIPVTTGINICSYQCMVRWALIVNWEYWLAKRVP